VKDVIFVANTSALRESAVAVFREATWAAKVLRSAERQRSITKATKAFSALFNKQGKLFMDRFPRLANLFFSAQVSEASYDQDLADVFAEINGTTRAQAERAMFNSLFDAVTQGYGNLAGDFGIENSFKIAPDKATEWARTNAASKVTQIEETTQTVINKLVTDGIAEGKSYSEVAREIEGRFKDFAEGRPQAHIRSRAELVAVQENAMAYEAGQAQLVDQIQAVGIRMEKSIGGPSDDRTSEICLDALSMGWVPMDTVFPGGEMTAPLHVACRHDTRYRVAEE